MRVINTGSFELEEFTEHDLYGKYTILSHTWGQEEVSFADYDPLQVPVNQGRGYSKIWNTCRISRDQGYHYVWIDTCCIDKKSSAELSEAINSMWRWYERASVCIAYLEDVYLDEISSCW